MVVWMHGHGTKVRFTLYTFSYVFRNPNLAVARVQAVAVHFAAAPECRRVVAVVHHGGVIHLRWWMVEVLLCCWWWWRCLLSQQQLLL